MDDESGSLRLLWRGEDGEVRDVEERSVGKKEEHWDARYYFRGEWNVLKLEAVEVKS